MNRPTGTMPCGDNAGEFVWIVLENNRENGHVTSNGVVYDWWLASIDGAGYAIFQEDKHSQADMAEAARLICADHDVVGRVRVIPAMTRRAA